MVSEKEIRQIISGKAAPNHFGKEIFRANDKRKTKINSKCSKVLREEKSFAVLYSDKIFPQSFELKRKDILILLS